MKKIAMVWIAFLFLQQVHAQHDNQKKGIGIPINISVFTETIGFPNFSSWSRNPNFGIRVGTEFYYSQSEKNQLFQTIQLGYYYHKEFHQAFFLSSEFGYRRYFGDFFADATVGLGYMLIDSALPKFESAGDYYVEKSGVLGRFSPSLGLGAGYKFPKFSVFSRYEMFGEVPFGLNGIPGLPHTVFHLGTRIPH